MRHSRYRSIARIITGLVIAALYLPLLSIIFLSFATFSSGGVTFSGEGYVQIFSDRAILESLRVTFVVAMISTVISTTLGLLTAYGTVRPAFPGRKIIASLALAPLIMPELVLGISLLIWFVLLRITLGQISIILAHVTFTISYSFVSIQARLKELDPALEEAAHDLGASPWQTFTQVILPNLRPAIISGALMAFTVSFDDFFITFFTAGPGSDTLPLKIYSLTRYGIGPEINALSTLLLLATFLLTFLLFNPFRTDQRRNYSHS